MSNIEGLEPVSQANVMACEVFADTPTKRSS